MANLKALATFHVGEPGKQKAIVGGTVFERADIPGEAKVDDDEFRSWFDRGFVEETDEPLSENVFAPIPQGPTMNPMQGRPLTLPRGGVEIKAPPVPKAVVGPDGETNGPSAGKKANDPRNSPT